MPSILHKSPKAMLNNTPFVISRSICKIVGKKCKHLIDLKKNFKTYSYSEKIVEIGVQKAFKFLRWNYVNLKKINTTTVSLL